jgi:hypothetical protein
MTIVIDGTNGISGVDGTASNPAYEGTDSNTGLFYPAADTVGIATGGTEALRVTSLQNVGIGTATPAAPLEINRNSASSSSGNYPNIRLDNQSATGYTGYYFYNAGVQKAFFELKNDVGALTMGTSSTERARITSGGDFLVGATSTAVSKFYTEQTSSGAYAGRFYLNLASSQSTAGLVVDKKDNTSTTSQVFMQFTINNQGTGSGQINANGASQAAFGSFSDLRLKENIVDLPSQLANIMALRPVEFDYIESEGGGHQISFIAQEFEAIYPDAVGERFDGMKTLTGWSKTEARLVKAIQELKAELDATKAEVAALRGQA